uniref:Photosystem I assembly protein Ycf4 n=1 Tax=Gracilaria vermiculophylla TaxID=2608709 RepID=A0A345U8X1_9FLOR|nr:photosystem I assembly protein ycf4 [Gracilaria vermiculophylla]AXI96907.1 photosystem I assembly protein ycf4 [Gracilaria vermiculophylla]QXU75117.1 photosystem I assembly protein ycf4 [Gracilaria vermiculophylla]WDZ67964.1 photosystem I assembly protein Ycf4 [Gracilaria vermiculophylla]
MYMSQIKIDKILGSRRISNYFWAAIILVGGLSFLLAGLSSYLQRDLLPFTKSTDLLFLPQGVIMTFYGTAAILISIFLWLTIIWNVGSGYNEFNREVGLITICRLGFPGNNRILQLKYRIQDIYSIKVEIQEGLVPRTEIYLKTKDKREIPLTRVGQPIPLSEIEEQAVSLAKFLGVALEGIA